MKGVEIRRLEPGAEGGRARPGQRSVLTGRWLEGSRLAAVQCSNRSNLELDKQSHEEGAAVQDNGRGGMLGKREIMGDLHAGSGIYTKFACSQWTRADKESMSGEEWMQSRRRSRGCVGN